MNQFEVNQVPNAEAPLEGAAVPEARDLEHEEDSDDEILLAPPLQSFAQLREQMTPIINDSIYKRIIRAGDAKMGMVPRKARVAIRYTAFWENETTPFDSSNLRCRKFIFETGKNAVLIGLEQAVLSMYLLEQAEFIISYKLLFREMGCPPRIRPRADALFKIKVLELDLVGDLHALKKIPSKDRCNFSVVYPCVEDMHKYGKDCVKMGYYKKAIGAFEKAISSLNYCEPVRDDENQKKTEFLMKLFTNIMICYNILDKPKQTIKCMNTLRGIAKDKVPCKALFHEGRALSNLGEFERAREAFLEAKKMEPNNMEIKQEIINMERRASKYNKSMKEICARAISLYKKPLNEEYEDPAHSKIKEQFQAMMTRFGKCSLPMITLNRRLYTDKQVEVISYMATLNNMKLESCPVEPDQLKLSKMPPK